MRNIILSVIAAMSAMLAVSCQKGDGEADYGNSLIYIPQATVSAGIDNYYNVPSGGAENTLNFGTTETDWTFISESCFPERRLVRDSA